VGVRIDVFEAEAQGLGKLVGWDIVLKLLSDFDYDLAS